jgi:starch phosphorylase
MPPALSTHPARLDSDVTTINESVSSPPAAAKTEVETATIGPFLGRMRIAYFSMEIALDPQIHTYSGGLGILAGDTVRASADLDLPMVFVTLASRNGYLRQQIDSGGNQVEHSDPWPLERLATPLRAKVAVILDDREVWVRPWLYLLGGAHGHRVPVLLLDTDLPENDERDRGLTDRLYGGDETYRFKQEVVLGIGGLRLLQALGFSIQVYHLNEGHAAFLALDLLRRYPLPPDQACPGMLGYDVGRVRAQCIFTTHTPVEAGHDRFPYPLFERLLHGYFPVEQLRLIASNNHLNMTELALNLSGYVNGVAERHAQIAAKMFPGYHIRAVTNGVHVSTWVHPVFADLFAEHAPAWAYEPELMARFDQLLPDECVWDAHQQARAGLFRVVAERTGVQLDPALPALGFARRITAYKRPTLLFADLERLRRIHEKHPFQLVIAGKAHPADASGRDLVHRIHQVIAELAPRIRVVFLPNYDFALARPLVAGLDVWLNTPEAPLEASGTSGMKAGLNGVLNLSVLDGWWLEGCIDGVTGWGIPSNPTTTAQRLYDKLEQEVLPLYHDNRPRWIWMMKQSISKIGYYFNSHRMMRRYATEAYLVRRVSVQGGPHAPRAGASGGGDGGHAVQ